ncbi:MAG: diguanylate cyclase [Fimbriimonadaceae bacterium]|nr:diguanylate cyclase [Fimbriimonadaceae bacterium]
MTPEPPAESGDAQRRQPPAQPDAPLDAAAEQERLLSVSESRADAYEQQAEQARSLHATLNRTEGEMRRIELLRHDLAQLQLPHFALLDLAAMIQRGASLDDLLDRVLEQVVRLFEAQKSSILVPDESGAQLRVAAERAVSGRIRPDFRMPLHEGVAGYVWQTGELLVVDNTAESPLFCAWPDQEHQPQYLVAVPLKAEGERLGVLCLERPLGLPASEERISQVQAYVSHASAQLRTIQLYQRLLKQVEELTVLCDISRELSSSLQHEQLLQRIVQSATRLLDCGICSLMLFEDDKQTLRIRHAVGLPDEVVERAQIIPGSGVSGWVAETGKPLLIEDITKDDRFQPRRDGGPQRKYSTRSLLSVPLTIGTEVVGVLNVNNKTNNAVFTAHDLQNLTLLASQAAVSIENARLYETLQRLAVTDPLTRLFRRNYFEEQFDNELRRSQRYGRALSVMMIDIDFFKRINDTYGHPVGDRVLQGLAGLLRRYARKDDVIARYGGEEFVTLLVETDGPGAVLAGERIRQAAEAQEFEIGDGRVLRLTISVGTASFPPDGDDREGLLQRADLALYAAKHGGRNRVCSYHEGLAMPTGGVASDR